MSSLRLKSGSSGSFAGVDVNGNLLVVPGTTADTGGFITADTTPDAGSVTGTRDQYAIDVVGSGSMRATYDNLTFAENFSGTTLNTAQWNTTATTMTVTVADAAVHLNSGAGVAVNTNAQITSWKTIPFYSNASNRIEFYARVVGSKLSYKIMEMGVGYLTGVAAPTEGIFFRWTQAGELRGVLTIAGGSAGPSVFEYQTNPLPIPADGQFNSYKIVYAWHSIEFWINGVKVGGISYPSTSSAASDKQINRAPAAMRGAILSAPVQARVYIPNLANAVPQHTAPKLSISNIICASNCEPLNKTAAEIAVSCWGGHSMQGQSHGAAVVTNYSNFVYTTDPSAAALSNTAAGYTSLGGLFTINAPAGAATDYALFSMQVPAQTNATQYKNLYITDVRIDTVNTVAAVATTPTVFEWALVVGSTAVSLATADAAATRAYRRIPLGSQELPLGAAIGAMASPTIQMNLQTPAMCPVGLFAGVLLKIPVGSATASEVYRGSVMLNGYWGN